MLTQYSPAERASRSESRQVVGTAKSRPGGKKSAPARILVVDDEALIRWSIGETLRDRGYEIAQAGDATTAIRSLSEALKVDVVFLDLLLPDCNDLRALATIRQLTPRTPVILMTAFGSQELVVEAQRLGAFAVVEKPFAMEVLVPLVERALAARTL